MEEMLESALKMLLTSNTPSRRQMKGGLALAYTPAIANREKPDTHKLTMSRMGADPTSKDIADVKRHLTAILLHKERPYDTLKESEIAQNGRWHSISIEWREIVQRLLL